MPYYENTRPPFWQSIPTVTRNLLLINIVVFVATFIDDTLLHDDYMYRMFALFYPASPFFRIWQPLTHMFMHGGFWHLFFNMYTLLMFGAPVERAIGERKFLIFYFICGFGAMALHWGVQWCQLHMAAGMAADILSIPTVGASGAIYGVLIAFAMLYPDATLVLLFPPIPLKAKWWVLIFAGIEVVTGITGTMDGIAHFAHLGGMLIGFLLMLYWRKSGKLWQR
ncbi:MAG: rhomboid family intramembrane serine protease [Bacteroidales bacterium]|jgi:membrane associated rhomboid family serine protease|nr:rhomboid family intramembrane serine protease [Bacteroidales bacterium]